MAYFSGLAIGVVVDVSSNTTMGLLGLAIIALIGPLLILVAGLRMVRGGDTPRQTGSGVS